MIQNRLVRGFRLVQILLVVVKNRLVRGVQTSPDSTSYDIEQVDKWTKFSMTLSDSQRYP